MKYILIVIALFHTLASMAQQESSLQWETTLELDRYDEIKMLIENFRGGITAVGSAKYKMNRGNDIIVASLRPDGYLNTIFNHGGKKDDGANAICQTYDGGYIIAGYTESAWPESKGGRDGWLIKTSEKGSVIWDKIIGTEETDELFDVVQDENGDILTLGEKNNMVYILKTDFYGKKIWDQQFVAPYARGKALAINTNGDVFVTGIYGDKKMDQPFLAKINSATGGIQWQKNFDDFKEIITKEIKIKSLKNIIPTDLIINKNNGISITGTVGIFGKREEMFLIELDDEHKFISFKTFGGDREDGANALIQTYNDNYFLVGYNSSDGGKGERRSEMWLNYLNPTLSPIWDKVTLYGNGRNDYANDIIQMQDGSFIIGGVSTSLIDKDATLIKLKGEKLKPIKEIVNLKIEEITFVDQNKNNTLEPLESGYISLTIHNPSNFELHGLKLVANSELHAPGINMVEEISLPFLHANSKKKISIPILANHKLRNGTSTFNISLANQKNINAEPTSISIRTQKKEVPKLILANMKFIKKEQHSRNDEIIYEVSVVNNGEVSAKDVKMKFFIPKGIDIIGKRINSLGDLAPQASKSISIKLKSTPEYQSDKLEVETWVWEKTKTYNDSRTHNTTLPKLSFSPNSNPIATNTNVQTDSEKIKKETEEALRKLENERIENEIAEKTKRTEAEAKRKLENTKRLAEAAQLEKSEAAERKRKYDAAVKKQKETEEKRLAAKAKIQKEKQEEIKKTEAEKLNRLYANKPKQAGNTETLKMLKWALPDPIETGYEFSVNDGQAFDIKFQIKSVKPLTPKDFTLQFNGQEKRENILSEDVVHGATKDIFIYKAKLKLKDPAIQISLLVKPGNETFTSKPIKFIRKLSQQNLHIFAFGIPHEDLSYSAKDALDFINQFKKQGESNKIFKSINIHSYSTDEETTASSLEETMIDIRNAYVIDETIKKDDYIILFFSSHGFISKLDDKFRLAGSKFDARYENIRSIDFEDQVLKLLADIPARKLIFLDACYSGGVIDNNKGANKITSKSIDRDQFLLTTTINNIAQNNSDFTIFASCRPGQESYEYNKGKNGVFTEALIEAFENKEVLGARGDKIKGDDDNDHIIFLDELYYFTKERVPVLLKNIKPSMQLMQLPFIKEEDLGKRIPIFNPR